MRKKTRATLISILFLSAGYGLTLLLLGCSQRQVQGQVGKAAPRYEVTDGEMEKTMLGIRAIKGNPRSHYRLARHYQERLRHHEAIREFRKALSIDQGFFNAYMGMGVSYDNLGNYQSARAAYRLALKLKPNSADVLNNMGYSAFLEGSYDEAAYLYERAVAIDGKNRRYHNNLGKALLETGDYEQALSQFLLGVEDASAYYMVGRFFYDREEYGDAAQYFSQAVKINPDMKGARKGLLAATALADIKERPASPPPQSLAAEQSDETETGNTQERVIADAIPKDDERQQVSALPGEAVSGKQQPEPAGDPEETAASPGEKPLAVTAAVMEEETLAPVVPIRVSARLRGQKDDRFHRAEREMSVVRTSGTAVSGTGRESREIPAAEGNIPLSGGINTVGTADLKVYSGASASIPKKQLTVEAKGASGGAPAGAAASGEAGKTPVETHVSTSGKVESAGAAGTVTAAQAIDGIAGESMPAGGATRVNTSVDRDNTVDARGTAAVQLPSSGAAARQDRQVTATGTAATVREPSSKGSRGRAEVSFAAQSDEVSPADVEVVAVVESETKKGSEPAPVQSLKAEKAAGEAHPPTPAAAPAEETAAVTSDGETGQDEKASVDDSTGKKKEDYVLVRCHVRQDAGGQVTILQFMNAQAYLDTLEIEVVNESGSGEITEDIGGFLKERGYGKVTVAGPSSAIQKKTMIYYRHDYLQSAFRVAKDIPGYQNMSGVDFFESSEAKIKVVIGSDMKRYASLFQRREEYAYTSPR
ncbi:LytR C-terminal domain-containing protein [Candidatus Moduliflexota bacterium]